MFATSSSRKRPTSSRKTLNWKSNIKSRSNVLQILNSNSDDDDNYNDENNKTNDNSNDKTNDNSNDKTNRFHQFSDTSFYPIQYWHGFIYGFLSDSIQNWSRILYGV